MRALLVPRGDNFEQRGSRPFHVRFRQRGFLPAGRRVLGQSPNERRTVGFGVYADGQNAVLYGSVRLLRISKNYPYGHFARLRLSRSKRWVSVLEPAFRLSPKGGPYEGSSRDAFSRLASIQPMTFSSSISR